jgi:hypothetical protein
MGAFIYVSAIKLRADGSTVNSDNCAGSRTALGEYTLDLGTDMSDDEAFFVVQPMNGSILDYLFHQAVLQPDGSTVIVKFSAPAGFALDSAFGLIAYKFQADA